MMRCDEAIGLLVAGEIEEEARAGLEEHCDPASPAPGTRTGSRSVPALISEEPPDPGPVYWGAFGGGFGTASPWRGGAAPRDPAAACGRRRPRRGVP